MTCPSCRTSRKGRRACPALGEQICTVCCGTKRLVEIDCPSDCGYLATARQHPAAATVRQQEADVAALLPSIQHLSERQHQLFFVFQTLIARYVPEGLGQLLDVDVAEATRSAASTLETAAKGVLYAHTPASLPAQRLSKALLDMLAEMRAQGAPVYDREAALVLRAVEHGAGPHGAGESRVGPRAYLELMDRLLQANRAARTRSGGSAPGPALIVP